MIHRAILGSVERMIAILAENYAGKWPFWLNPRQIVIVPIASAYDSYAQEIQKLLHEEGLFAEADVSDSTFKKKIRNAEVAQWNYILCVGADEEKERSVNVRSRDDAGTKNRGELKKLDDIVRVFVELKKSRK